MKQFILQFHMTCPELEDFIKEVVERYSLYLVVVTFPPYSETSLEAHTTSQRGYLNGVDGQLLLSPQKIVTGTNSILELIDNNPEAAKIVLAPMINRSMRQLIFTAKSESVGTQQLWASCVRRLKKNTKAGVYVSNPQSGARAFIRAFRFSKDAERLYLQGVTMLPAAGDNRLHFE